MLLKIPKSKPYQRQRKIDLPTASTMRKETGGYSTQEVDHFENYQQCRQFKRIPKDWEE
jgi:hypothetical protein